MRAGSDGIQRRKLFMINGMIFWGMFFTIVSLVLIFRNNRKTPEGQANYESFCVFLWSFSFTIYLAGCGLKFLGLIFIPVGM